MSSRSNSSASSSSNSNSSCCCCCCCCCCFGAEANPSALAARHNCVKAGNCLDGRSPAQRPRLRRSAGEIRQARPSDGQVGALVEKTGPLHLHNTTSSWLTQRQSKSTQTKTSERPIYINDLLCGRLLSHGTLQALDILIATQRATTRSDAQGDVVKRDDSSKVCRTIWDTRPTLTSVGVLHHAS